ncbi:MAG: hypothetical protein ABIK62_06865, partial [candidate division WOR-3 bacterium]
KVAVSGENACVTNFECGLQIVETYRAGSEECPDCTVLGATRTPLFVRGVLHLPESGPGTAYQADLLDVTGRRVRVLRPGANEVSSLSPGIYFLRGAHLDSQLSQPLKVVIQK